MFHGRGLNVPEQENSRRHQVWEFEAEHSRLWNLGDETREVNAIGTLPSQEHRLVSPSQEHRLVRKLVKNRNIVIRNILSL